MATTFDFTQDYPVIGEPLDGPMPEIDLRIYPGCGHCGGVALERHPYGWRAGRMTAGDRVEIPVLSECTGCGRFVLTLCAFVGDDNGMASLVERTETFPTHRGPESKAKSHRGTAAMEYRDEAWRCYGAGLCRSALVMTRSALQALVRRYLDEAHWGNFATELSRAEPLFGPGWHQVGRNVKSLGNTTAHPEPGRVVPATWQQAHDALNILDSVMDYTSFLEEHSAITVLNA